MLNNSNLIDGTEAKELEKALEQYNDICLQLKDLEETKKVLSEKIKATCKEVGKHETTNYVVNISERKGTVTVNGSYIQETFPEIFAGALELGKAKIGEPTQYISKVTRKGKGV